MRVHNYLVHFHIQSFLKKIIRKYLGNLGFVPSSNMIHVHVHTGKTLRHTFFRTKGTISNELSNVIIINQYFQTSVNKYEDHL